MELEEVERPLASYGRVYKGSLNSGNGGGTAKEVWAKITAETDLLRWLLKEDPVGLLGSETRLNE